MKSVWSLLILIVSFSVSSRASSFIEYSPEILQLDPDVRVESVTRDGQDLEIVRLGNGQSVEIPVDPALKQGLKPEEFNELREASRVVYENMVRVITSDHFNGLMSFSNTGAAVVLSAKAGDTKLKRFNWFRTKLRQGLTTGIMTMDPDLMKSVPSNLTVDQKLARFLKVAWQFVIVETVHAGIQYYDKFWSAPKLVEFGISIDVKVEPQIFIGKFNPTQKVKALRNSYALGLEMSFDFKRMRGMIRTRLRREKGAGGLGLPAAKLELKIFQTDGTHRVQGGQSWYPISPPFASFVLDRDRGGHYFAQGITIGANSGDLIPGSTLTNTFANYQQIENPIDLKIIGEKAQEAFDAAATTLLSPLTPTRAPMCSSLFAPAI